MTRPERPGGKYYFFVKSMENSAHGACRPPGRVDSTHKCRKFIVFFNCHVQQELRILRRTRENYPQSRIVCIFPVLATLTGNHVFFHAYITPIYDNIVDCIHSIRRFRKLLSRVGLGNGGEQRRRKGICRLSSARFAVKATAPDRRKRTWESFTGGYQCAELS